MSANCGGENVQRQKVFQVFSLTKNSSLTHFTILTKRKWKRGLWHESQHNSLGRWMKQFPGVEVVVKRNETNVQVSQVVWHSSMQKHQTKVVYVERRSFLRCLLPGETCRGCRWDSTNGDRAPVTMLLCSAAVPFTYVGTGWAKAETTSGILVIEQL